MTWCDVRSNDVFFVKRNKISVISFNQSVVHIKIAQRGANIGKIEFIESIGNT